jgi:hypothetical protein
MDASDKLSIFDSDTFIPSSAGVVTIELVKGVLIMWDLVWLFGEICFFRISSIWVVGVSMLNGFT